MFGRQSQKVLLWGWGKCDRKEKKSTKGAGSGRFPLSDDGRAGVIPTKEQGS